MSDPFDTEFFNAIDRLSTNPASFSGMLEYFRANRPDQWLSVVGLLMEISKRDFTNVRLLGLKLEEMVDDYAKYMDSEPEV